MSIDILQKKAEDSTAGKLWLGHGSLIFILVAAALLAYANNFAADFVYDDYPFILENPAVRSLSQPVRFFTDRESFSNKGEYVIYRPLASLSFAVNYVLGGYNSTSYHVINILLHAVCGLLVYLFFFSTFKQKLYAFFAALIFLLHPVQTEAVSWIAARGNSLFLIFLLLCVMSYKKWTVQPSNWLSYGLALIFVVLSLLSKEMAVVLPLLLLVYDGTVNRPEKAGEWKRRVLAIIPFMALSLLYVLARHLVLGGTKQMDYWGGSFSASLLVTIKAFAYYVRLMFVPRPLMVEYVVPIPRSLVQPTVLISLLILFAIALVFAVSYKRNAVVAFGIAWFFVSLIPVSNVIPLQAVINERFLYLPSLGFCAILAAPVLLIRKESKPPIFAAAVLALVMVSVGYGVLTFDRNKDWRDSLSLWTASVKASPIGTTSQYNLGLELFRRRRYDEAIEHLKAACLFQPHFPSAHGVLGNTYFAKGEWDGAIREYEIGLFQAPEDIRMRHNLAVAWFEKGNAHAGNNEPAQAARCFLASLKYEPGFVAAKEKLQSLTQTILPETPDADAEIVKGRQ